MKKKFYIFLDIDGVLWSVPYILNEIEKGNIKKGGVISDLEPNCIQVLNTFINKLETKYDVQLVITSSWRYFMDKTIYILKSYGLEYYKEIDKTIISKDTSKRGVEIKHYLKDKKNYEFVIIDDETFDYAIHFKKENIIKTDLYNGALTMNLINEYLNNIRFDKKR